MMGWVASNTQKTSLEGYKWDGIGWMGLNFRAMPESPTHTFLVGESDIREEQAWWLEFKVTSRRKARQLLRLVLILQLVIGREN